MTSKIITIKPMLYGVPMVRALNNGIKTMTRRPVNRLLEFGRITEFGRSDTPGYDWCFRDKRSGWNDITNDQLLAFCPYGNVGGLIWVREQMCYFPATNALPGKVCYAEDHIEFSCTPEQMDWFANYGRSGEKTYTKIPSIHMPKWACRIFLEITSLRVELLNEITEADAKAEGFENRQHFIQYWNELYGQGSFERDADKFHWVVGFRRVGK